MRASSPSPSCEGSVLTHSSDHDEMPKLGTFMKADLALRVKAVALGYGLRVPRMLFAVHLLLLLAGPLSVAGKQLQPEHGVEGHTNSSRQALLGAAEGSPSLRIAPGNTDFALNLYHLLASERAGQNIFFSPLSISAALAMLSLGARSHTKDQILKHLGFNLTQLPEPTIHQGFQHLQHRLRHPSSGMQAHLGSSLFLSQDLELVPAFLNDTMAFYNASVFHTNFQNPVEAARLISEHVREGTRGKISDLMVDLSPGTQLVLVNYIYFKALWEKSFSPSKTKPSDFHVDENTVIQVPMMIQEREKYRYLHDRQLPCSVLHMGYKGGASALLILPDPGKMAEVEEVLTPEMLRRWTRLLQKLGADRKLELHFPKFSITTCYELDRILPLLGFTELFSPRADFSGIINQGHLQVPKSFHKATLDINEVGTEAAAVTSLFSFQSAVHKDPNVLKFNRPFLMAIFSPDKHNILFLGKIVNPMKL
ncbi:kallistatin [Ochotona princeps]|uniref:kallistatin n=1 Tax=Ochotona princeps TaxID=9978 RepID=UPI002714F956|nr:kallistatin [Ochotona princeps]